MNLTKNFIATAADGLYSDSGSKGLYLRVRRDGKSRTWFFKRQVNKIKKEISLGSAAVLPLSKARAKADHLRALSDSDFLAEVSGKKPTVELKQRTFEEVAAEFCDWNVKSGLWQELSKDHKLFLSRLRNHINPHIGAIPFDQVTPDDVARTLTAIWSRPHTMVRIRSMIRRIFNWGRAKGYSKHDNPATEDGPLQFLLPAVKPKIKNRGALAVQDVPGFMKALSEHLTGISFQCGFFAVLTATRSKTAREARWEQIDFEDSNWVIPPSQLKIADNGPLVVPLAPQVVSFLKSLGPQSEGLIFPTNKGEIMTDTIFSRVPMELPGGDWLDRDQTLQREEPVRATMHGIARASFRTWSQDDLLGNDKRFDPRIAELCLHHKINDGYNGAYERNRSFIRRREMMEAWADFCLSAVDPSKDV